VGGYSHKNGYQRNETPIFMDGIFPTKNEEIKLAIKNNKTA
jgi:hypothetical protein